MIEMTGGMGHGGLTWVCRQQSILTTLDETQGTVQKGDTVEREKGWP